MICFMIYQSIWRLSHYEDHLDVSEGAFIWHDSGAPAAFTSRIRQISWQHVRKASAKDSIVYPTSQLMLVYGVWQPVFHFKRMKPCWEALWEDA